MVFATPVGGATIALVAWATALRWGSVWLVAVGGAQAVLGSGGVVGPAPAAASAWFAAGALVLGVPGGSIAAAVATGATAAFLLAGPSGTDGIAVRVAATLVLSLLAFGVGCLPWRRIPAVAGFGLAVAAVGFALA